MTSDALKKIRIVFFGTPEFAVPALEALVRNEYNVVLVVTNPDQRAGRKMLLSPPPVKRAAARHKISVWQPLKAAKNEWRMEDGGEDIQYADILVVAAYGKILPKELLAIPRFGAVNIHPSLLPRWRGPSPMQCTVLHGDAETGVTLIKMDERMDHGPIIAQQKWTGYEVRAARYEDLYKTLADLGAKLLVDTLPAYINGEITPVPQDDAAATYSKILTKENGRILWQRPAEEIERMIRALTPWPGCWTLWPGRDRIMRIRIDRATVVADEPPDGAPGYVWQSTRHSLLVKTGRASIAPLALTPGGAKKMTAEDFLRGHSDVIGGIFV